MKKFIVFATSLLMAVFTACNDSKDEPFESEKPPVEDDYETFSIGRLKKVDERFTVVYYLADEEKLRDEFEKAGLSLGMYPDLHMNLSSPAYGMTGSGAEVFSDIKIQYSFGDYKQEQAVIALSHTLYWAPYYKSENGGFLKLSPFFYVTLNSGASLEQLAELAGENSVEIIGHLNEHSHTYILGCTNRSKGNTLEMWDLFYESGFINSTIDWSLTIKY